MPATKPSPTTPLWLRFWPQAVLCLGVGLMLGSAFSGLWWPGVLITLAGFALLATYHVLSRR